MPVPSVPSDGRESVVPSVNNVRSVDSVQTVNSVQTVDSPDTVDSVYKVDSPDTVDGVHKVDSQDTVDSVLAALADPMRRRILDLLASHTGTTATVLAGNLPVSRQAVVQHLAVLERVELVSSLRVGRERRYTVRPERLTATADWMTRVAQQWDSRLNVIRELAESMDPSIEK